MPPPRASTRAFRHGPRVLGERGARDMHGQGRYGRKGKRLVPVDSAKQIQRQMGGQSLDCARRDSQEPPSWKVNGRAEWRANAEPGEIADRVRICYKSYVFGTAGPLRMWPTRDGILNLSGRYRGLLRLLKYLKPCWMRVAAGPLLTCGIATT
jgi:hypothetical protein